MRTVLCVLSVSLLSTAPASAETVLARAKIPATGTPASEDNPPCTPDEYAKTTADRLREKGDEIIGKGSAQLGLGSDPFNTRRLNKSVCIDVCATVPAGAAFKARGSITPKDWEGNLPSGLPKTVNPGIWAAVQGPAVTTTAGGKADLVCYTFKNWSHNLDRHVGIELTF